MFSLVYLYLNGSAKKILSLAVKNIEVNFICFRSFIRIFVSNSHFNKIL